MKRFAVKKKSSILSRFDNKNSQSILATDLAVGESSADDIAERELAKRVRPQKPCTLRCALIQSVSEHDAIKDVSS